MSRNSIPRGRRGIEVDLSHIRVRDLEALRVASRVRSARTLIPLPTVVAAIRLTSTAWERTDRDVGRRPAASTQIDLAPGDEALLVGKLQRLNVHSGGRVRIAFQSGPEAPGQANSVR